MNMEVSAFAVYSGQVALTKRQKKRKKMKEKLLQNGPGNNEKIDEILFKKSKKNPKPKTEGLENCKKTNIKPIKGSKLKKQNDISKSTKLCGSKLLNGDVDSANKIIKKVNKNNRELTESSFNPVICEQNIAGQIFKQKHTNKQDFTGPNEDPLAAKQKGNKQLDPANVPNSKIPKISVNKTKSKKASPNIKRKVSKIIKNIKSGEQEAIINLPDERNQGHEFLDSNNVQNNGNTFLSRIDILAKVPKNAHRSPKDRTTIQHSPAFPYEAKHSKQTKYKASKLLMAKAKLLARADTTSESIGRKAFEELIAPFEVDEFMRVYWEKLAVHISNCGTRFEDLISTPMIDELLRHNVVMYGKHVDVTSYTNGVRETLNPEGRAHPHVIWDYYSNGCSIRLLNPQYFIPSLHMLLATLQEYFGCLVGANAYLTPPNSQGFAPHYDDIEAFVYQVEGKKHWKVYKPRSVKERLPRYSSPNFSEEEVGTPVLDVILSPGDVLYFPRGFIHHAKTLPGEHSLHITISTYQKSSWCDLLEKVLPLSLKKACEMDVDFRKGLPIGYLQNAGFAHSKTFLRKELIQGLRTFVSKLEQYIDVDSAVDQMGIQFMHDSLPPVFTEDELKCSVYNGGLVMKENGTLENYVQPNFNTKIRLLRAYLCRFVQEDMKLENGAVERQMRLYYNVDNSREYHGEDLQFLLIPPDMIASVHFLICAYPSFVTVNDLPCKTNEEKITLACDLWDRGLLMTDMPLDVIETSADDRNNIFNEVDNNTSEDNDSEELYSDLEISSVDGCSSD